MKQIIASVAATVAIWGSVWVFFGPTSLYADFGGLKFIPLLAIAFGVLSAFVPSVFQMGVEGWKKSSVIDKLQPIMFVFLVLYGLTYITQTPVTAFFASYLLGLSTSYVGTMIIPER